MKIGVTGSQLGNLSQRLVNRGVMRIVSDITDEKALKEEIHDLRLDVVIHAAAMTDVDACEADQARAFAVNVRGTSNVAASLKYGQWLILMSSDHVFGGGVFLPNEKSLRTPRNVYGTTKMMAEEIAKFTLGTTTVIRTSKLFSMNSIEEDLDRLYESKKIIFSNVVRRSFMHYDHFVNCLLAFIELYNSERSKYNILHIAGSKAITYYELWQGIVDEFDIDSELLVPRNYALKDATPRPLRGGLSITQMKKAQLPVYNYLDGIKLLREEAVKCQEE